MADLDPRKFTTPAFRQAFAGQIRDMDAADNGAQRDQARAEKAAEAEKVRQHNLMVKPQYAAENRPTFIDADHYIRPKHDDATWQQMQAAKQAKDALGASNKQVMSELSVQGRKHFVNPATGAVEPTESEDAFQARQAAETAAAAEKARVTGLSHQIQSLGAEAELNRPGMTDKQREKAGEALARAHRDAVATKAIPALSAKVQELDKGSKGSTWNPFDNDPAKAQEAETARAHLNDLNDRLMKAGDKGTVDLTSEDESLLDAPTLTALKTARENLAKHDEVSQAHTALVDQQRDLKLRLADPQKWEALQMQKLGTLPPDQLDAEIERRKSLLEERGVAIHEKAAGHEALVAQHEKQLADIEQENKDILNKGVTAGDLMTVAKPDGTTEDWHRGVAAKYFRTLQDAGEIDKQAKELRPVLQSDAGDYEQERRILNAAIERKNGVAEQQKQDFLGTLRADPSTAPHADALEALDADAKIRAGDLDTMYTPGSPEHTAAMQALQEDVQKNREGILQSAGATKQAKHEAGAQLYQQLKDFNPEIDWTKPEGGQNDIPQQMIQRKAQELGLSPEEATRSLQLQKAADWTVPHEQGILEKVGIGVPNPFAVLPWIRGDKATAERTMVATPTLDDLTLHFFRKEDVAPEQYRVLPNGVLSVNPALTFTPDAFKKAVDASPATPEAKAQALAQREQMALEGGKNALPILETTSEYPAWIAAQTKKDASLATLPPEAQAAKFLEQRDQRAWAGKLGDQLRVGVGNAILGLAQTVTGTALLATGSDTARDLTLALDAKRQKNAQQLDVIGSSSDRVLRTIGSLTDNALQMVGTLGAGAFAGKMARFGSKLATAAKAAGTMEEFSHGMAALGKLEAQGFTTASAKLVERAQMAGSGIGEGLQAASQMYPEAFTAYKKQYVEQGMSDKDATAAAHKSALLPVLTSAFTTSVIGYLGGASGAEVLLKKGGIEGAKKGFLNIVKGLGKESLSEGAEELWQTLADEFNAQANYDPNRTVGAMAGSVVESAFLGALMGGGFAGVHEALNHMAAQKTDDQARVNATDVHRRHEIVAAAKAGIESLVETPDSPVTKANAASVLRIAQGEDINKFASGDLAALGLDRVDGKIVPLKGYEGPQIVEFADKEHTQPIIRQVYIDALDEHAPAVHTAIGLDEVDAREMWAEKAAASKDGGLTPAATTIPAGVAGATVAGAETSPPHVTGTSAPDLSGVKVAGVSSSVAPGGGPASEGAAGQMTGQQSSKSVVSGSVNQSEPPKGNSPARRAWEVANHLEDRGLPREVAQKAAGQLVSKAGVVGNTVNDQIADASFVSTLKGLGLKSFSKGRWQAPDNFTGTTTASGAKPNQTGSNTTDENTVRSQKWQQGQGQGRQVLSQSVATDVSPSAAIADIKQAVADKKMSFIDAARAVLKDYTGPDEVGHLVATLGMKTQAATDVVEAMGGGLPAWKGVARQTQGKSPTPSKAELDAGWESVKKEHVGKAKGTNAVVGDLARWIKEEYGLPASEAARIAKEHLSAPLGRAAGTEPSPQPSPVGEGAVSADTLPEAKSAAVAALPRGERKRARTTLKALDKALAKQGKAFEQIIVGEEATARLKGMAVAVAMKGGKVTLLLDVPAFIQQHSWLARSVDEVTDTMTEEFIHAIAKHLLKTDATFSDANLAKLWERLPQDLRNAVYQAYHARTVGKKLRTSAPDLDEANAAGMTHEFLRMLVQNKAFRGRVTEHKGINQTGLLPWIKTLLSKLGDALEHFLGTAPKSVQSEVEQYRAKIIGAMADFEGAFQASKEEETGRLGDGEILNNILAHQKRGLLTAEEAEAAKIAAEKELAENAKANASDEARETIARRLIAQSIAARILDGESKAEIAKKLKAGEITADEARRAEVMVKVARGGYLYQEDNFGNWGLRTNWQAPGETQIIEMGLLGLEIDPKSRTIVMKKDASGKFIEDGAGVPFKGQVVIRQSALDALERTLPITRQLIGMSEHEARLAIARMMGKEGDVESGSGGMVEAASPNTASQEPAKAATTNADPDEIDLSPGPATDPKAVPVAAGVSPPTAQTDGTLTPSATPAPQSVTIAKNEYRRATFATQEDADAFNLVTQLRQAHNPASKLTDAERAAIIDKGRTLRNRLVTEAGHSKSEANKIIEGYHTAVIDEAKKADPFDGFTPQSFERYAKFPTKKVVESKLKTLAKDQLKDPTGSDVISILKGEIGRIGYDAESLQGAEWEWYRALQDQAKSSRLTNFEAGAAAARGEVDDPKALLQWINQNVVKEGARPIDEAAMELNSGDLGQTFNISATDLGPAILDAVAQRQKAMEQPENLDEHLEAEGEALLAAEREAEETEAIRGGVLGAAVKTDPASVAARKQQLTGAETTVQEQKVKTGVPVTFDFVHNTESSTAIWGKPKAGDPFDRHLEPSGRYVTETKDRYLVENFPERYIAGTLSFKNPIVIDGGYYETPSSWKRRLSEVFGGLRGKRLSQAIIADGYDGVITHGSHGPSEILDLTTFDESKALYAADKTGPTRAYESMTFDPPFEAPFGKIVSYNWVSRAVGQMSSERVSDWNNSRTNPVTGRQIVHHFKVLGPDGLSTVSLETAMGQLSDKQRTDLNRIIKSEQQRRVDAANGQMALFSAVKTEGSQPKKSPALVAQGGEVSQVGSPIQTSNQLQRGRSQNPIEGAEKSPLAGDVVAATQKDGRVIANWQGQIQKLYRKIRNHFPPLPVAGYWTLDHPDWTFKRLDSPAAAEYSWRANGKSGPAPTVIPATKTLSREEIFGLAKPPVVLPLDNPQYIEVEAPIRPMNRISAFKSVVSNRPDAEWTVIGYRDEGPHWSEKKEELYQVGKEGQQRRIWGDETWKQITGAWEQNQGERKPAEITGDFSLALPDAKHDIRLDQRALDVFAGRPPVNRPLEFAESEEVTRALNGKAMVYVGGFGAGQRVQLNGRPGQYYNQVVFASDQWKHANEAKESYEAVDELEEQKKKLTEKRKFLTDFIEQVMANPSSSYATANQLHSIWNNYRLAGGTHDFAASLAAYAAKVERDEAVKAEQAALTEAANYLRGEAALPENQRRDRLTAKQNVMQREARTRQADYSALWEKLLDERYPSPLRQLADLWRRIAADEDSFQYPKSSAKNIERLAREMSGGTVTGVVQSDGDLKLSSPGGQIEITDPDSDSPKIHAPSAGSKGKKAGGGALMYQIALAWAANNGKTINPSNRLSSINAFVRRTSNMLSSALRFGSTDHMIPDKDQGVKGWVKGRHWNNIARLAQREEHQVFATFPKLDTLRWDFVSGSFVEHVAGSEQPLSIDEGRIEEIVRAADPKGYGNDAGIGATTVQRAILTRSALEELGRGQLGEDVRGLGDGEVKAPGRLLYAAIKTEVDAGAHEAATSPLNPLAEPSVAQKEAGNYKVGRVRVGPLDISVENPAGSVRRGTSKSGKTWEVTMADHYGYVRDSEGKDGDHVDIFLEPGTPADFAGPVFVINQMNADGKFDEHKAILGPSLRTIDDARAEYLKNYSPGWKGAGSVVQFRDPAHFHQWVTARRRLAPASKDLEKRSGGVEETEPLGAARKIGDGITVFSKTIKTPYGSRYYHATFEGDWYHIRLADHANKSATGGETDRLFKDLHANEAGVGMTHPHELNVLLTDPVKTENEANEVIRRVLLGLPDAAKYRTPIERLAWEKDQTPQIYGNSVDVDAQYNRLEYSFEDAAGERFDEVPAQQKNQSRAESGSDMPGRGPTNLATSKTGETIPPQPQPSVNLDLNESGPLGAAPKVGDAIANLAVGALDLGSRVVHATGLESPLQRLGWNHLDKAVSAKIAAHTRWARDGVAETVAGWARHENVAPFARAAKTIKGELIPNSKLPAEVMAAKREMDIKIAMQQQRALDLVRALSGKAKFSDMAYPKAFVENPKHREALFDAMEGRVPMSSLPPEMQALGARLRGKLVEIGQEAVKQGRMSIETFEGLRENFMPRFTRDEAEAKAGDLWKRFKLGVKDILQQRTTAWHIVDTSRKDYRTQEYVTVPWDDKGKRWRFRDQGHRDAFYEQMIRDEALRALKEGGKWEKDLLAALSADEKKKIRAEIGLLSREQMDRPAEMSRELYRITGRAVMDMRTRFRKEKPIVPENLVRDPVYAIARYAATMTHDNATAEFFNHVAANPDYISDTAASGFTEIPDTNRFGRLAGKHVRDDIAGQILELVQAPSAAMEMYDTILGWWKTGKTVLNPGTHMRNLLGNTFFSQLAGNSIHNPGNLSFYKKATSAIRDGGADFTELYENGVLGADYASVELRGVLRGLVPGAAAIEEQPGVLMGIGKSINRVIPDMLKHPVRAVVDFAVKAYQVEDDVFKAAAFFKARAMGMDGKAAAEHVRKWFPYFDGGSSGTLRALGRTALPFLGFYRESIRIFGNAVKERPIALAAGMAVPSLITLISAMLLGLDDDDLDEVKKDMRGKGGKLGGLLGLSDVPVFSMLLPARTADGQLQQFDISAIHPFADFFGRRVEMNEDQGWYQALWRSMLAAGPIGSLAYSQMTGKDTFGDRAFVEDNMTTGEKVAARADNAAKTLLPPLAPFGTGWKTLASAGERQTNKTFETRNPTQAVARAVVGLDVRGANPNLYRLADDWRAKNGLPSGDGADFGTTPVSRARATLFQLLAQDEPNASAVSRTLAFLKEKGSAIDSPKDIKRLLALRNPLEVIRGHDNQQRFRASLTGEPRRVLDQAVAEYNRIVAKAPGVIFGAMSAVQ